MSDITYKEGDITVQTGGRRAVVTKSDHAWVGVGEIGIISGKHLTFYGLVNPTTKEKVIATINGDLLQWDEIKEVEEEP